MAENWNFDLEMKNYSFTPQNFGLIFEGLKDDFYGFDAILCWPHICRIGMDENLNFSPKSENSKNAPRHIFHYSEF